MSGWPERDSARAGRFPVGAAVTLDELTADPHPVNDRLRATEPVSWLPAMGGWLVTSRSLALEVLRDDRRFTVDDPRFSTARVVGPSMLSLDGAAHRRHRRPFLEPFRAAVVERELGDVVRAAARGLVERVRPAGRAELRTAVAGPLAVATITAALGLDPDGPDRAAADRRADRLLGLYRAIVAGVDEVSRGGPLPAPATDAVAHLRRLVEAAARPGSPLARIAAHCELTADERFANVAVVLFGAIETSEGMTANALLHCLMAGSTDGAGGPPPDPRWLAVAVEESLRLEPAAAVVDRYTTGATVLGGIELPAGELVRVSLCGANRDPAHFDDPHRFHPLRPNAADHLAFAVGPHACLGLHLARLETVAALEAVLTGLDGVALDPEATRGPHGLIFRKPPAVVAHWR